MVQTYQPPQMEVAQDTPPELQPIFSFLNSHSNKLYQEGYFLKLHDLDSRGRPSGDRTWIECFAQLVGTVLSLWDAAALDLAGEDGEVVPTFINLSDASIKMIESLPMSGAAGGNLQNVLSISTAANNRYLLHFNSLNSLTQWTAGIRLAMFEHATLQEAYTGSLIAGKGRFLNNIRSIMERSKFVHEDWARVRFGAGTPWRRCWCVVSPPDEKEYQKAQKEAQKVLKKNSAYERRMQVPKGDIKFYDTRKVQKKTKPIATITDAYAAYAIYPQSKPLIDQSTLVKLEGLVTIHSAPETTTEGFVFVMPEVHPAVTGFEMMLRWLFPVFDTFALYGRPQRLIADTLDQRGLMFAMPRDRRYGYLDILDASGLIHTSGSQAWSERQWRKEMKKLTGTRMMNQQEDSPRNSRQISQRRATTSRTSLPPTAGGVHFDHDAFVRSDPPSRSESPVQMTGPESNFMPPRRVDSAPPGQHISPHKRSVSDAQGYRKYVAEKPSRLSYEASRPGADELPPPPPKHGGALGAAIGGALGRPQGPGSLARIQSEAEVPTISTTFAEVQSQDASPFPPPAPVMSPPAFTHSANSRPANQPYQAPELRRAHSDVDAATLYQMQDASRADRERSPDEIDDGRFSEQNRVGTDTFANGTLGTSADRSQGTLSNPVNGQTQRDQRQRLDTIPASPFVNTESEYFQSPQQTVLPQLGGVAEERSRSRSPNTQAQSERPGPPVPTHSSHSISRKPIPRKLPELPPEAVAATPGKENRQPSEEPSSPESPSSHGSLTGALIDQDALERILQGDERASTMASSVTPDYASTAPSVHSEKKSFERPRAGKLKTVGDPDVPQGDPRVGKLDTWEHEKAAEAAETPTVDFGPTFVYKPTSRPGTSGTLIPGDVGDRSRSRSADRLRGTSRDRLGGSGGHTPMNVSPNESKRHSYFGGGNTPSPGGMTPVEAMNEPGNRHSMVWTPGAASAGGDRFATRQGITPEQWVQYRASIASQPQQAPNRPAYAHNRQASSGSMRKLTKTPPLSRHTSGDWSQPQGQRTPPSRPNSRGANAYLAQQSPGGGLVNTQPISLTAREQMHVARATGTPLVNVTNNEKQKKQEQEAQAPGLIGAVAARQQEKEKGIRGSMVEQAIRLRQQQQLQMEAEAQAKAQAQAQAQWDAQQQAQAQQQAYQYQQHVYAQQQMMAQNQAQMGYPQRPVSQLQSNGSGQYYAQPGYGALQQYQQMASPGAQYNPSGGFTGQQQAMQQQTQSPRQAYGASYFAQQQQQQSGQGQQWQPRR